MGLKFRKSVTLAPGVKLNAGKKSAGISVGGKYGGMSFNSKTGTKARVSAPGTGLSYTKNLSSTKKRNTKSNIEESNLEGSPFFRTYSLFLVIPFRIIAVIAAIAGVFFIATGVDVGIGLGIGCLLLCLFIFLTIKPHPRGKKLEKMILNEEIKRQLEIFDNSINIFMSTNDPEKFFGRYTDAETAANMLSVLTEEDVVHGESPSEAVEMLIRDKTDATNAFLARYAKVVYSSAIKLTRGRISKIETFKLITAEYEDSMTQESIDYRNKLYESMISKIKSV